MRYNSNQFDRTRIDGKIVWSAEASDLHLKPGEMPYGQVFPDAIDAGIIVTSHKTGKEQIFLLTNDHNEVNEGCWTFIPYLRYYHSIDRDLRDMQIKIFND